MIVYTFTPAELKSGRYISQTMNLLDEHLQPDGSVTEPVLLGYYSGVGVSETFHLMFVFEAGEWEPDQYFADPECDMNGIEHTHCIHHGMNRDEYCLECLHHEREDYRHWRRRSILGSVESYLFHEDSRRDQKEGYDEYPYVFPRRA